MTHYTLFVGVDISAKTATAAWGVDTDHICKPLTLQQQPNDWKRLVKKLQREVQNPGKCLIVMEATGTYWMKMALYLYEAGFCLSVINPIRSRSFARLMMQKTKTDAIDASLLAQLGMTTRLPCWTPPPSIYYELQQRLAYRDDLVAMRVQENNRLHALRHQATIITSVQQRLESHLQYLVDQIRALDREIEQLLAAQHEWTASAACLQTIPGIGTLTTAWILTATLNFSMCATPEEASAFAGLAPFARQSGSSLRSHKRVGHGGHARLRQALYLAALPATRFNPRISHFYHRLVQRGKPKKVALCAAARKLLHIAWAVATTLQDFDPDHGRDPVSTQLVA